MTTEKNEVGEFFEHAVHWLAHSPIRNQDGGIYSWLNPEKPGYIYPEIMGYYTKLFSYLYLKTGKKLFLERAVQTADKLVGMIPPSGGVSREGTEYVFDSAMCLSGFIALSRVSETEKYKEPISLLSNFVYHSLEKRAVAFSQGREKQDDSIWSLSFGPSSLKCCIALLETGDFSPDTKYKMLTENLSREIINSCFREGFFTINSKKPWVYTHPHCYATEGLLFLQERGYNFSFNAVPYISLDEVHTTCSTSAFIAASRTLRVPFRLISITSRG